MTGRFEDTRSEAAERDARDPLAAFRSRFYSRPDVIYLDGNSLGLASREAEEGVLAALEDWKRYGIDGWLDGDQSYHGRPDDILLDKDGSILVADDWAGAIYRISYSK